MDRPKGMFACHLTGLAWGAALLMLAFLQGCSKPTAPTPPIASPTAHVAVTDVPTGPRLTAKTLNSLDEKLSNSDTRFVLFSEDKRSEFVFVNIEWGPLQVGPGLLIVRRGKHELIDLTNEGFAQHGWIDGFISYDRKHIWAITDTIVESPSWDFNVVHSADGGATWVVASTLHKPYYLAGFSSLRMRPDGSGELYLLYEDNPANPVGPVPVGYYVYTTKDWGNSWSSSVHVPDILQRPDEVPSRSFPPKQTLSDYLKESLRKTDEDH